MGLWQVCRIVATTEWVEIIGGGFGLWALTRRRLTAPRPCGARHVRACPNGLQAFSRFGLWGDLWVSGWWVGFACGCSGDQFAALLEKRIHCVCADLIDAPVVNFCSFQFMGQ